MGTSRLPTHLNYLRGFLDALCNRDPGSIDETIDTTALLVALKQRVDGNSAMRAAAQLRQDKIALDDWLAANPDHPGHFVSAFISEPMALVHHLETFRPPEGWKPRRAPSPRPRKHIQMEIPPGFRVRREGSGLFLQMGEVVDARHCVGVTFDRGPPLRALKTFSQGDPTIAFHRVCFGALSGTRVLRNGRTVTFLLRGGRERFSIQVEGDSRLVEPFLHTLRVSLIEI